MGQGTAMMGEMAGKMLLTKSAVDLRMDMRKLWEDNSQWQITRRSRGKGFNLFGLKSRPCPKVI